LYYLKLSIIIGLTLTAFVYIFDPYDTYLAIPKYDIPIPIVQLGYGINSTLVIYFLYWIIFHKIGFGKGKRIWKTYHHWLLLVAILSIAGFIGTVYHRFMMDVGEVDTKYYIFVTIPRSILIAVPLFIITILLDLLHIKNKELQEQKEYVSNNIVFNVSEKSKDEIFIKSPIINQTIRFVPQDIVYIKASGNYVEMYLKQQKQPKLIRASLAYIAEQLKTFDFIKKCHRQYYINVHQIQFSKGNSQRMELCLKDTSHQVPVSKSFTKKIKLYLKKV